MSTSPITTHLDQESGASAWKNSMFVFASHAHSGTHTHTHTHTCTPTPIALIHPTTLTQTQRVPGIEGTASSGSGLAAYGHTHTRTRTHTQTAQKFSQSHIITHSPLHRPHHPQISTPHSQRVEAPQRHQGRWMMPSPPLSKAGLPSTPSPPSDVTSSSVFPFFQSRLEALIVNLFTPCLLVGRHQPTPLTSHGV
jgi:hypothetical protein